MRIQLRVYFFFWLVFSCSVSSADTRVSKNGEILEGRLPQETEDHFLPPSQETASTHGRVTIVGKPWVLIHQSSDKRSALAQYVPAGKTLENSQELVTVEFFMGVPTDADSLQKGVEQTHMVFQKRCPSMDFRIINQTDREILYEWRIGDCEGASNQSEIVKVSAMGAGLAVIHYAAKQADLPDAVRRQWRDWLGKSAALEALVEHTANKV